MHYSMQKIIDKLSLNSPNIFLLDSMGALLSGLGNTFALFISLKKFGLPIPSHQPLLYAISFFMLYSLICYFLKAKLSPFLLIIILLNSTYLLISSSLTIAYKHLIPQGIFLYFILEGMVILAVIILEIWILKLNTHNPNKRKRV